jgi:hypothetical protein
LVGLSRDVGDACPFSPKEAESSAHSLYVSVQTLIGIKVSIRFSANDYAFVHFLNHFI